MQRSKVLRSSQVSVPRPLAPVPRNPGLRLVAARNFAPRFARARAIRGIDHQRRSRVSLGAAIPPEIVVGALDVAARALVAALVSALCLRRVRARPLLLCENSRPATSRDARMVIVRFETRALQVGLTPRRPWGVPSSRWPRIARCHCARGLRRDGSGNPRDGNGHANHRSRRRCIHASALSQPE